MSVSPEPVPVSALSGAHQAQGLAFYNENDPFAAAWLRELIKAGLIAPGVVDERDIRDVRPDDVAGFVQCHFFAGIGVWSYALRRAGWPDDKPVWTGSCPCQPFSTAGGRSGLADERHLWPAFFHLIQQRDPGFIFGEQVASKDGLAWLDIVSTDMEAATYTFAALDLCAAGFGAPHIRQRLFWVAHAANVGHERRQFSEGNPIGWAGPRPSFVRHRDDGRLADANDNGCAQGERRRSARPKLDAQHGERVGGVGNADSLSERRGSCEEGGAAGSPTQEMEGRFGQWFRPVDGGTIPTGDRNPLHTNGFWRNADWLLCRDRDGPRWRPVEPETFPLADGAPGSLGLIRGSGNAINAEVATAFIEAVIAHCADSTTELAA